MPEKLTGPRGGKTTRTKSGAIRKTFWLPEEVAETLRVRAFEDRQTETAIVVDALREHLGIPE